MQELASKLGIRGRIAVGAIIALFGVAGCGGAGARGDSVADAAATANKGLGLNGPFGLGGPFEGPPAAGTASGGLLGGADATAGHGTAGHATAGLANSSDGRPGVTVQVSGSTALVGARGLPWLVPLGYGVGVTAPLSVRPGTDSPADAAAGFYDAFYEQRFGAACGYVVPWEQASCPVLLRESAGSADTLHTPAIGFQVVKGSRALVTMTGLLCRTATGCVGQHNTHWIFGMYYSFDTLWTLTARHGGNPLTVTPFTEVAGRWYLDLKPAAR